MVETTGTIERLVARLLNTDVGKQMAAEDEADLLEHRRTAVAEITRLDGEYKAKMPALQKAEDQARAEAERTHAAYLESVEKHARAKQARHNLGIRLDAAADRERAVLRGLAPDCIGEFLREFRNVDRAALYARLLASAPVKVLGTSAWGDSVKGVSLADRDRVSDRMMEFLRSLRERAEALQVSALTDLEIESAIAGLRAELVGDDLEAPRAA